MMVSMTRFVDFLSAQLIRCRAAIVLFVRGTRFFSILGGFLNPE